MGESGGGAAAAVLQGGQRVRVRVRSHQHYGLSVEILGHDVGGSIDWMDITGPNRGRPRPDDFPVGAEFEAVTKRRLGVPPETPCRCWHLMILELSGRATPGHTWKTTWVGIFARYMNSHPTRVGPSSFNDSA